MIVKAHAFGNDFLLVRERGPSAAQDRAALARALCERHRGIGADGLIVYQDDARRARRCACSMPTAAIRRCRATACVAWALAGVTSSRACLGQIVRSISRPRPGSSA